jgi:hypothetical protein
MPSSRKRGERGKRERDVSVGGTEIRAKTVVDSVHSH